MKIISPRNATDQRNESSYEENEIPNKRETFYIKECDTPYENSLVWFAISCLNNMVNYINIIIK